MRRFLAPTMAIIVAVLGTVVLVNYVRSAEARALAGERLVDVLVLTQDVPAGTAADDLAELVRVESVPSKIHSDGAVSSLEALTGRVTAVELLSGETLVERRFVAPENAGISELPPGHLEVTVSLDPDRAVGGAASAGQRVAVLASFAAAPDAPARTEVILDGALVTRVQLASESSAPGTAPGETGSAVRVSAPSQPVLVTLALSPDAAETFVFAAEHGEIWLAGQSDGPGTSLASEVNQ